jgi:hypothetical protein
LWSEKSIFFETFSTGVPVPGSRTILDAAARGSSIAGFAMRVFKFQLFGNLEEKVPVPGFWFHL